mgnify:CR=1 FL=1
MSVWFWLTSVLLRVTSTCIKGELVVNTVADPGISKLGGAVPASRIFGSGVCFDAPSHIPYGIFSENIEQNTYCKHCVKVYAYVTQSK